MYQVRYRAHACIKFDTDGARVTTTIMGNVLAKDSPTTRISHLRFQTQGDDKDGDSPQNIDFAYDLSKTSDNDTAFFSGRTMIPHMFAISSQATRHNSVHQCGLCAS